MRKLLLGLASVFMAGYVYSAPVDLVDYTTSGDVTITNLETNVTRTENAFNSFNGAYIQPTTISADALVNNANPEKRWYYAFNEFVISGLLPSNASSLTLTIPAGKALIKDDTNYKMKFVEKDASSKLFTASKNTYVDLDSDGTLQYDVQTPGASEPAVQDSRIRICLVSTDNANSFVTDKRIMGVTNAGEEDFYRSGLTCTFISSDTSVLVQPGTIRHGTTFLKKTTPIFLYLQSVDSWVGSVSARATSTMGYVVIDSSGNVDLTTTAPTKSDIAGNTNARKRYSVISGSYYRVLGWFYMNASGSGNIDYNFGNYKDEGITSYTQWTGKNDIQTTSVTPSFQGMENFSNDCYVVAGPLKIDFSAPVYRGAGDVHAWYTLKIKPTSGTWASNTHTVLVDASAPVAGNVGHAGFSYVLDVLTQDSYTISLRWAVASGGTIYQRGSTDGHRFLRIEDL